MKNKKKILTISISVLVLVIVILTALIKNIYASNQNHYAIDVIKENATSNDNNLNVSEKIVKPDGANFFDSQELDYEVCLENIAKANNVESQIAMVVDGSKSMAINDSLDIVRTTASELATDIINNVTNSKISISNNDTVKRGMTNNITEITNTINNLTLDNEEDSSNALEKAYSTFSTAQSSGTKVEKYLIVFTDASDNVKEKMQEIVNKDNDVNIISVLIDAVSTYYYLNNAPIYGDVYLLLSTVDKANVPMNIEYYSKEKVYNKINKTNQNIKLTNVFSDEIQKYFSISKYKADNGTITQNATGYEWAIDKLARENKAKLTFTLTLNTNTNIDAADVFENICTNKTQDITYTTYDNKSATLNGTDERDSTQATTIQIGKGYELKIKAVSEANNALAVEGIEFNIIGKNKNGENICSITKTTDSDGYITITEKEAKAMRIAGTTTFSVTPNVTVPGYGPTASVTFEIENIETGEITYNDNGLDLTHNIKLDTRTVEVNIPIATKKFSLIVNLAEQDNSGVKIGDVEFRLIQPKINNKYELSALYGTTSANGQIIFNPTTIAKAGTYEYILSQTSENPNYESMGNVTLRITFDNNGQVTKIEKKYNDKVTTKLQDSSCAIVNVYNINKNANKFNFTLELSDETNKNDKLENAIYNIEVVQDDGSRTLYENQKTDENGQINLELQGTGYVQIKVKEILPQAGYYDDPTEKEIIVRRVDGAIKFLVNNPSDLNTSYTEDSVKLNLTSKMNANQSLVKISVADSEENDILFPNVKVKLIGLLTNEEYDGITDADGIATFKIQPQKPDIYPYKIVVDNTSLPNGYSDIAEDIRFSIEFGATKEIEDTSNISNSVICQKTEYTDEDFTYKVANVKVLADVNEEEQYNFKINLTDVDSGEAISGATYELTIDNGTIVKKIPSRITNENGEITTRIIASDNVTVKVKQIKSKAGYKIDSEEQTIELKKVNGMYQIINQWPYDYSDNLNGAIIDGNNIIYKHTNERKNNDSVLLNVYINKKDKEDNLIASLPVRIYSDTLKNSSGGLLNEKLLTDTNGYIQVEKIKVTNIKIPQDSEHFLYIVETDGEGNDIESSLVKMKLTFRYNENKQIVELTNAESTWGNRFLNQDTKTFNGYETDNAYESNLYLDIYGNIADVGNFSLDLRKLNKDKQLLEGAIYDVIITRLDGTKLIKRDLKITDNVEFSGIIVGEGTKIEITEFEAPIGYKVNKNTEVLNIETISDDGSIVASFESGSTSVISDTQYVQMNDGSIKTCMQVDLYDESINTFKFGIQTVDQTTNKGVAGFGYYVFTDRGIQVNTDLTNNEGKIDSLIGSSYPNKTVTYTIKEIETAEYYKKLKESITLKIAYAEDGTVDTEETLKIQTDANFKKIWNITETNNEKGNDIEIQIKNEPQDPFTVELQTVDKITGAEVTSFEYKITPSVNLEATGKTDILVGYVAPGTKKTYSIDKIEEVSNYAMYKQNFSLVFDADGNIAEDPSELTDYLEFVSRTDKSVKLKIYVEPKIPITINSIGYFNSEPLENTQYTITQKNETQSTSIDSKGMAKIFNGIFKQDEYVTYTITENKITTGYVKLEPFQIKVHFNSNKEIDDVQLIGEQNRWIALNYKTPSEPTDYGYNGNNKGIVQITLKHYPEFLINIKNQDRLNNSISLAGTKYTVETSIGTRDDSPITDQNGMSTAMLGKTLIDDKITYIIKEIRAASLYQTIERDVKVEVTFDENGYAKNAKVIDGQDFAEATTIANITDPRENFEINVIIKNCKMLKFNITAIDSEDSTYALRGLTFEAKSKLNEEKLSSDTVQTDENGQGTLGLDKDYANETITYTIKETKKIGGYEFPNEDLVIEVTFDSNGKLIPSSVKMTSGAGYTSITNIDAENFAIDLKILNKESEEFGLNIVSVDKYDETIKIPDVHYETYMTKQAYAKDDNYAGNTVTDSNGEGYVQYGKYMPDNPNENEIRTILIKESNLSENYRPIRVAAITINVTFDPNGKIIDATVSGGYNTYVGWTADTRFVSVTHSKHTIEVTVKHYPYLFMNVKAEDIYTGETLAGKYKISTTRGPGYSYIDVSKTFMQNKISQVQDNINQTEHRGANLNDLVKALSKDTSIDRIKVAEDGTTAQFIVGETVYTVNSILDVTKAQAPGNYSGTTGITNIDYVGYGIGEILEQNYQTTNDGNWAKVGIGPTETLTERTYYIYEETTPSTPMQYQQYRPRYLYWEYSKIIATITVKYTDKGRIESYTIDDQNSNNNIAEFLELEIIDGTNLGITIKYAPTTTMEVTTIDNVSKEGLSNIKVSPFLNSEYATRQSYEYRTIGYYTTNTDGITNYTYWGGNINEGQNEYHINTDLMGYQGYFNTGLIKIHVAYDENGRISAADVISTDENGMPNAEITGFENNKLKINILFNRRFNINVNKQDEYDSNTKLTAVFNMQSDKGEKATIQTSKLQTLGMIRPGETVKYTVSETSTPQNYYTLDNFEFFVTFNNDGTIKKVQSNSNMFSELNKRTVVDKVRQTEVEDLEIAIKNEPQFIMKINAIDKFYDKVLPNITYQITNNNGDTATGNPVTDSNGSLSAIVGKSYQNKTVTYEIKQTSTPNGYYTNNQTIKIKVEFNAQGKIKNYEVIDGQDIVRIDTNQFKDQRYIKIDILNRPKDIYIGIENYDKITKAGISGITYEVSAKEISGGNKSYSKNFITNNDGTIVDTINDFKETTGTKRVLNYTIKQISKPDSYRKIQDVVVQIAFNEDGSIASKNVISNPSNVEISVDVGKLQYVGKTPVHILFKIANDNAYDLIIKDEDTNYSSLGIKETIYDISINGETLQETTDNNGLVQILSRQDVGNITIRIAENKAGTGYQNDINNNTIIEIEKGTIQYSLKEISNSNPNKANVVVDEEYGTIEVTFKNETRSSIKLIKDNKDVRYKITQSELDSAGNPINTKDIGTDIADTISQEELYYELGVTPQNKKRIYTFEEVKTPGEYYTIGTFNVTVEYDMYGNIKNITTDSNRVNAIENGTNTHDIVVIISEYEDEGNNSEYGDGDTQGSITIIKDNKEVRYKISSIEMDDEGKYSNAKEIGTDEADTEAQEDLYYDLGLMPISKTVIIKVQEVKVPQGYNAKGTIQITAKINKDGLIYSIEDDCDKATVKLIPNSTNNIALVIGDEYGSVTLYKDHREARYQISSKEKNSDGTYSDEKIIKTEKENTNRKLIYVSIREPIVDKDIVYKFTPISVPDDFISNGEFEVETHYDTDGKISQVTNNNYFVSANVIPENSSDLYVVTMTDEQVEKIRNPYTIKVVSQEVESNLRINESKFDIKLRQGDTNIFEEQKGVLTSNASKKGYIVEKGVIKIEKIKKFGEINIDIDQKEPAEGYKFGNEIITGTVKLNVQYPNMKDATIDVLNKAGFDVSVDDINKIVTIKVNNEPEANMEINNILKTKDEEGNTIEEKVEDSKFIITSQIQTKQDITDTDLNVTTAKTDKAGNTSAKVGRPYLGKNVIYTIHQVENAEYEKIEDIILLVTYDTKGEILYQEILSNPDDAKVIGEIGTRNIKIQVINTIRNQKHGYKIILEKHHIDNEEYEELIPGAKFKIEVEQEYGEYYTSWEAITDTEGKITSSLFDGYGNINIKITELTAPEGFEIKQEPQEVRLIRNKSTGKLTPVSADINYNYSEDYSEIILKPVDEPKSNLYTIMINKQDKRTHKQITESSAKFDVTMITEENIGTEEEPVMEEIENYVGSFSTSNNGKAKIENLEKPSKAGTYKFIIKETESPKEYIKPEEDIVLQIEFVEDAQGKIVMGDNPQILSGDGSIRSKKGDLLNIIINNENEKDKNKYTLDITKVDAETKEPIEAQALFKVWLPDKQNTALYTETSVNDYGIGKLDYCYIEQDKDYATRLTRMEVPKEEGTIKYVFREIIAPEGYKKIDKDIELDIEFKKYEDKDGMYINSITSNLPEYIDIKTDTPCTTDTVLKIDILNDVKINKQFTIKYIANDDDEGTTIPKDQIKEFDEDIQLDELVPKREGYIFRGWATRKDATDIAYNPGDIYRNNENITLYAIWEKKLYLKSTEYYIGTGENRAGEIDYWTPGNESTYKEGDLYIQGIRPQAGMRLYPKQDMPNYGTYLEEFLLNLETNADKTTVYIPTEIDSNGNRVLDENSKLDENDDKTLIKTGMVVKLTKGSQEITLTIIVRGDLTDKTEIIGDGICGMWESNKIKTLNRNNLETNYSKVDQMAIDFYINKVNNYQINKNAIRKAYQEHNLKNLNIK